jgi:hypothetical protein
MPARPSGSMRRMAVRRTPSTMRMLTLTQLLAPDRYWMATAPATARPG